MGTIVGTIRTSVEAIAVVLFVCGCVGLCAVVLVCVRLCWFVCGCVGNKSFGLCAVVLVCVRLCSFVCGCVGLCALTGYININIKFVCGCMRSVCCVQLLDGPMLIDVLMGSDVHA